MGFRSVISIMSPKSLTYDPNAYAVITAIQSTGVTLSDAQKLSCNRLIKRYKAANIWTKQKALYGVLGGTAGAHKWNWVNPLDTNAAFRLTFATGWTHSSNGMLPNGTSAYASTFLIPNTNLTNNNSHISVYLRTNTDNNGIDIGIQDDMGPGIVVSPYYLSPRNSNTLFSTIQTDDANRVSGSNTDSRGFYITSRTASNSLKQYKNSSIFGTNTNASTGTRARYSIPLGALRYINDLGSDTYSNYSNREQSFASIGDGLTDTEASDQFNIVEQYQIDNGRGTVVGFVPTTEIGTGTSNNYEMPFKGIYNYSISASIYLQSELGTLPKRIKSIQFYFAGFTTPYTVTNQEIWIAEVAQSSFDAAPAVDFSDLTITNLTQVKTSFTHTVTANNQWYQFDFNTPFTYNGTSNLIVIWKNYDGSATISGAGYGRTTSATNRGMYKFNDPSFPTGDGTRVSQILNAKFIWDFVD